MGFNYGLEKKNFDRQWAIMRKQYEDAGMSIEVIQAMYEYDWSVFNAARSYQNHTQEIAAPSFEQGEESYSSLMNKYQEAIPETNCQGLFHQIHKKSTKKVPEAPYGS